MTKKTHKRIASIVTGGAMLLFNALPVLAADVTISGNGSDSENDVSVARETTTTVVQSNDTNIRNSIRIDSSTGDNEANDNTGGEVGIMTGDADVSVLVSNMANMNDARVNNCDSCGMDAMVEVTGNGSDSESEVSLHQGTNTSAFQENYAYVNNDFDFDVETGDNEAEDNTGGDTMIGTGDVDLFAAVQNRVNYNRLRLGGGQPNGASAEVIVSGNGSDSDNDVHIASERYDLLTQANNSYIVNEFDFDVDSGDNEAEDNTGGEVGIATGDLDIAAFVSNAAGFNSAWLDCCVLSDEEVKVSGNGSDSDSDVHIWSGLVRSIFQDNSGEGFYNDFDLDLETGDNEAEDNTHEGDPFIWTGDSDVMVDVANEGGMNHYGAHAPSWDWPEVEFSFNMAQMMAWLR